MYYFFKEKFLKKSIFDFTPKLQGKNVFVSSDTSIPVIKTSLFWIREKSPLFS